MSKVVNAIMATKGDRVRHKPSTLFRDIFSVREDIKTEPIKLEIQYSIGVNLGSQCWVSELEQLKHEDALELAVQRTKRQVIEVIFGEFREDFRNIERALYDSDIENARIMLHRMEDKMFEVTLD
jgi:hypothetical protein